MQRLLYSRQVDWFWHSKETKTEKQVATEINARPDGKELEALDLGDKLEHIDSQNQVYRQYRHPPIVKC